MRRFWLLVIGFILLLPTCAYSQRGTVFVVESYHADFPWDASYKKGLREVISDDYQFIFFQIDTKRTPAIEHEKRAQQAWEKYQRIGPDLVVLADDNALKHLGSKFVGLTTPVVYLGINNNPRKYSMVGHQNITGVLERPLMKRSLVFIRQFLRVKKALFLLDTSTTTQVLLDEIFYGRESISLGGTTVTVRSISNYTTWKKSVLDAKRQGYDLVFAGSYYTLTDDAGVHVNAEEILRWTSENTPIPPFCFWDFAVGPDKTIGGYVLFGEEQGKVAGKMAMQILSGAAPATIIPKTAEKGRFLFSRKQLEKWQLSLPANIAKEASYTE